MADLDKNEKNWLIKSSSKILGPFTAIEIAQAIIKKHISIIDEVRRPHTRWSYIRENAIFSEVVQNLRQEQNTHIEETVNTAQNTLTLSRTDWASTEVGTPTPMMTLDDESAKIKDVTPTQSTALKHGSPASSFGTATDQRVQTQMEEKSRGFGVYIWAATLVLMIGVGWVVFKKFYNENRGYEKNIRQAMHFNHILLHEKAVEYFHQAQDIREPDQSFSFQMALLVLQADRHSLWARKIFETELAKTGLTRQESSDAFIGIGLSYVIDGDLKMAQDFFNKALAVDPENFPANFNLAFNYIKKGDYGLAAKIFSSMVPTATTRPYVLYGIATLAAESQNYSHQEVQAQLSEYIKKPQPLRKEIGLILAYLQMTDKNQIALNATMESLINIPLQESAEFVFDPRLDRRVTEWEHIDKYCMQIFQHQGASALGKAFHALCLLEENRDVDAKKWIDEALAQDPRNKMVNLVYVHFLMKSRRLPEAATLLKSGEFENLAIMPLLLGKVCLDLNDSTCALENFKKSFLQNPNDVTRISLWARMNFKKEKEQLAKTWDLVKKGLEIQSQYKPLIELRDELENQ